MNLRSLFDPKNPKVLGTHTDSVSDDFKKPNEILDSFPSFQSLDIEIPYFMVSKPMDKIFFKNFAEFAKKAQGSGFEEYLKDVDRSKFSKRFLTINGKPVDIDTSILEKRKKHDEFITETLKKGKAIFNLHFNQVYNASGIIVVNAMLPKDLIANSTGARTLLDCSYDSSFDEYVSTTVNCQFSAMKEAKNGGDIYLYEIFKPDSVIGFEQRLRYKESDQTYEDKRRIMTNDPCIGAIVALNYLYKVTKDEIKSEAEEYKTALQFFKNMIVADNTILNKIEDPHAKCFAYESLLKAGFEMTMDQQGEYISALIDRNLALYNAEIEKIKNIQKTLKQSSSGGGLFSLLKFEDKAQTRIDENKKRIEDKLLLKKSAKKFKDTVLADDKTVKQLLDEMKNFPIPLKAYYCELRSFAFLVKETLEEIDSYTLDDLNEQDKLRVETIKAQLEKIAISSPRDIFRDFNTDKRYLEEKRKGLLHNMKSLEKDREYIYRLTHSEVHVSKGLNRNGI